MARNESYGPTIKKRARRFLEGLVKFANYDLANCNDFLEQKIKVHWKTDRQLVVTTQIPALVQLTVCDTYSGQLSNIQVKEAIKKLDEFLGILEDNRASRQGASEWHFTIKLWFPRRELSENLRRFDTEWEQRRSGNHRNVVEIEPVQHLVNTPTPHPIQDWGNAMDIFVFHGRQSELSTLEDWILNENCRLLNLLGMGGIGKTTLAIKLARQIQPKFDCVIWRSLRNAPSLETLLADLVKVLSRQQEVSLADYPDAQISRLMDYLRQARCLLVLDNAESVLQGHGHRAGCYRAGYEGYGQLLRIVSENQHQSCLLLTSREKPGGVGYQEGNLTKTMVLSGLSPEDSQALLTDKGLQLLSDQAKRLIRCYCGNPLALKIAATTIQDLFDGQVDLFFDCDSAIFGDISDLLGQQINRLSEVEMEVMYWLAVNREWTSLEQLQQDLVPAARQPRLIEVMMSLQQRSLIEQNLGQFTQQSVVMDYMCDLMITQIALELQQSNFSPTAYLNRYPLTQTHTKDYLQQAQTQLILRPLIEQLLAISGSEERLQQLITQNLNWLQLSCLNSEHGWSIRHPGYAAGNLLKLLQALETNLTGYDLSNLAVWQIGLQNTPLHRVNLSRTDLSKTQFIPMIGSLLSAAFSPDGTWLATSLGDVITIWQVADGRQINLFRGHSALVVSVAFHPNGHLLASASHDHTARLWDLQTGDCVHVLQGDARMQTVVFSPNGDWVVTGDYGGNIQLWQVVTGNCVHRLEGHFNRVYTACFSSDGQTLVTAGEDKTVRVWNLETLTYDRVMDIALNWVDAMAVSSDGKTLAVGCESKQVEIWNLETGNCIQVLENYHQQVWSLTYSPDGKHLVTADEAGAVKIWQVATGICVNTLIKHPQRAWLTAISPNSKTLVSASDDKTLKFWDMSSGHCLRTLTSYDNWIFSVAISPDGHWLVSGSEDHRLRIWDLPTGQCVKTLQGHKQLVSAVAFYGNNSVVSGSDDGTAKRWDICSGNCLQTYLGHQGWVSSVAVHLDSELLVTGSHDQTLKLWDVSSGECKHTLVGHEHRIMTVAFSPNGQSVVSGSDDGVLRLWSVATGKGLQVFEGHEDWVLAVAFSADGRYLVSGSADHTVRLWSVETGHCCQTMIRHTGRVRSVAISPDDQWILSTGEDQQVYLWKKATGEYLQQLQGHDHTVWSVAFSPDGQWFVSGSADSTMRVWSLEARQCEQVLRLERPYEGMNITGALGLTNAQRMTLGELGAIETIE